jgi:ssDNA-binding replication factor A large subunit
MFDELLDKIEKQSNLPRDEILNRIDQKCIALEGLITKEGAAYLVARECGIVLPSSVRKLEIKNIVPGMKNINVSGRIFKISQINEFERSNGNKGRVVNILVSDGTGFVRVPLWNDQVELVENETIKLGDAIQIVSGMSKENVYGDIEISLGKFGTMKKIEDTEEIPSESELSRRFFTMSSDKAKLKDIVPGSFDIQGTIVQVFKGNFLFGTCPICSTKLDENKCQEHGTVEPNYGMVISCVVDDSTDDLRVVFFRDLAERLCNITSQDLVLMNPEERYQKICDKLLCRELIISGKVRNNKMFERLEMMANDFRDINILEETKKLAEEIELKVGA